MESSWGEQVTAVRDGRSTRISITSQTVDEGQFRQLADGCEGLTVLEIDSADVSDEALAVLEHCPALTRLKLGAPVADAGAARLAGMSQLEILNLPEAQFSDAGLKSLSELQRLELLRFHSHHVTDAGMSHVAEMTSLRFLHLIDVPITDAGLIPLSSMTGLESFYLDGGQCTDDALRNLLRDLPELHFHRDQLHLPGDPNADPH